MLPPRRAPTWHRVICIGAKGERYALPLVGRQADVWNTGFKAADEWTHLRGVVDDAARSVGRDPSEIESCVTLGGELPENDTECDAWLERLRQLVELGITSFVFDFGHPLDAEPVIRFGEQVIAPLKAG